MKVLSIDIGIKNLALCLFEKTDQFQVTIWDVVNISEENAVACCGCQEKNGVCNKPATFKKGSDCFCTKHAKKQPYHIPTAAQLPSFIRKQKVGVLRDLARDYDVPCEATGVTKTELVQRINERIQQTYLEKIERAKASDVGLFAIGRHIKDKLNHVFSAEQKIDYVIIENQIGPLAIRMKTVQCMIVQYFVMSHVDVDHIDIVSASNKLKDCDAKDKATYSDRKKLSIAKCKQRLTTDARFSKHLDYFNSHKKKDDLSDSFLQGMWYIEANHL